MGGTGSGRCRSPVSKPVADGTPRIDVFGLHGAGRLAEPTTTLYRWNVGREDEAVALVRSSKDSMNVRCSQLARGELHDSETDVKIEWTPCHFGGQRPWFLCPKCSKRAGVLYGRGAFLCRECHDLAYECQRETLLLRKIRKCRKLRSRLDPLSGAPRRMRRGTRAALVRRILELDFEIGAGLGQWLERVEREQAGIRPKERRRKV